MTVSACESTEQESARIGREGQQAASAGELKLGALNHHVRVSDVTLVSVGGRMAVAAKLTASATRAQADVPVGVDIVGAGGKTLYSNTTSGVEASLQHVGLLRPHQPTWWVDDQVLTSQHATAVKVRVGSGSGGHTARTASLGTASVHTHSQGGVTVVAGRLVNHSRVAPGEVAIYAVALKGKRVVAAGRGTVASLPGRSGSSAPFQVFLVGSATGANVELTAVPAGG
ncbi:MAG: hypothetical protein ACYDHN_03405 [Solirubrobacteraceae bacterium]